MPNKLTTSFAILATGAALFVAGCGDDENTASGGGDAAAVATPAADAASPSTAQQPVEVGGEKMYPDKNVVENASAAPNLSTLVAAVKAADLVETLSGEGPFTVFAPDNAAFEKLPEATLADLLKPENKQQLTDILTYHVVPGTYAASDLTDGQELKTVNGETLAVSVKDGTVKVGDATVTQADVFQSNGVAHVIDTVLQP